MHKKFEINRTKIRGAVSWKEKWYPMILRVIYLYLHAKMKSIADLDDISDTSTATGGGSTTGQ